MTMLLASIMAVSACSTSGEEGETTKLSVATAFYPLEFVASRVAGDAASVTNLSSSSGAHGTELSGRQVADIDEADVVVYQPGFQPAIDEAVEAADRDPDATIDSLADIDTLADGSSIDPHVWLDPQNMIHVARTVENALSEARPDLAEEFDRNARDLIADLEVLDQNSREALSQCDARAIVTSHDAFAYFAQAYDLRIFPIAGIEPSSEPSSAQLARLSRTVRSQGIDTIFTEELVDSAIAETLARETGAEVDVLDPIEGLSDETQGESYISLMEKNVAAVAGALGCSPN
jgi:zinc transport system substrate-binding protein